MHAFWHIWRPFRPILAPIFEACPKNGASCFRKKAFAKFRGCPFRRHVPKTGVLIFRKQGWPFLGGALCAFWGILGHFGVFYVPKTGHLVFGKKLLPISGGAHFGGMSQKRGTLFSENKVGHFWGVRCHRIIHCRFHMHQIASTNHRMWCCCGYLVFSATGQSHARWQTPPLCTERIS